MEQAKMTTQLCPKCNSPMVERPGKYGRFLGCTSYPKCRGTRNIPKVVIERIPLLKITPSPFQNEIFDFVRDGTGNGVIEAVAGSGKTTTIVMALSFTPKNADVAFCAFNKHIANELQARAPQHVHVSTLHSLGYANIRAAFGRVKVDNKKVFKIVDDITKTVSPDDANTIRDNLAIIVRLVSMCKATMRTPTIENLGFIVDRYTIEVNGASSVVFETVQKAFNESMMLTSIVDFDDMIYYSSSGKVPCRKFDFLFLDECQDLNNSQISMALKSVKENGRIIAVGDRWQGIYGFRGADVDAIPNIINETGASTLPLSITYRCPKSHVALAQELVPHIKAWSEAKEGVIETIGESKLCDIVQDGDMVLCRRNAPLISYAFKLLRRGIKVVILGRDIASGLVSIIAKVQKQAQTDDNVIAFLRALREYQDRQVYKLERAGKNGRAQTLDDKCETIMAIAQEAQSVKGIIDRIDEIFSDIRQGVTFSTVHKAKGQESERVFLLKPGELGSTHKCKADWERQQEKNIQYVAVTRSKSELYFVESDMQGSMF